MLLHFHVGGLDQWSRASWRQGTPSVFEWCINRSDGPTHILEASISQTFWIESKMLIEGIVFLHPTFWIPGQIYSFFFFSFWNQGWESLHLWLYSLLNTETDQRSWDHAHCSSFSHGSCTWAGVFLTTHQRSSHSHSVSNLNSKTQRLQPLHRRVPPTPPILQPSELRVLGWVSQKVWTLIKEKPSATKPEKQSLRGSIRSQVSEFDPVYWQIMWNWDLSLKTSWTQFCSLALNTGNNCSSCLKHSKLEEHRFHPSTGKTRSWVIHEITTFSHLLEKWRRNNQLRKDISKYTRKWPGGVPCFPWADMGHYVSWAGEFC